MMSDASACGAADLLWAMGGNPEPSGPEDHRTAEMVSTSFRAGPPVARRIYSCIEATYEESAADARMVNCATEGTPSC